MVGGVVSLPLLIFVSASSYRYGLQWLGFYFACAGCSSLVFAQPNLRREFRSYLCNVFPSDVIVLLLMIFLGPVIVNGFSVQATGVLTALLVLATFPVWDFWCKNLVYCCHSRLLLNIVVGVLVAEAIF